MLIYNSKLRFFGHFCLVLAASPTFFNGLLNLLVGKVTARLNQLIRWWSIARLAA
jgi:hypothetical protein